MMEPTSKPAAVLLLFLLHSCVANHVFLSSHLASQVLVRNRRANQMFEEMKAGYFTSDLERECVEEICDHKEAGEVFMQPVEAEKFWSKYLGCNGTQMSRTAKNIYLIRTCIKGQCISAQDNGVNYTGDISITQSGRVCQHWRHSFPHPIFREYNASEPGSNLKENFCRNPDSHPEGPWCFTKDPSVQKETCRVPICGEDFVPPTVATKPHKPIVCLPNNGIEYNGDLSVTIGGHTCLPWSLPEVKTLSQDKEFIPEVQLQTNKCRNPDGDFEGPWCYVRIAGNITMDYCDLQLCEDPLLGPEQTTVTEGRERSVLGQARKNLFSPRTFGQGEDDCGQRRWFEKKNKTDAKEACMLFGWCRIIRDDDAEMGSAPWNSLRSLTALFIFCHTRTQTLSYVNYMRLSHNNKHFTRMPLSLLWEILTE